MAPQNSPMPSDSKSPARDSENPQSVGSSPALEAETVEHTIKLTLKYTEGAQLVPIGIDMATERGSVSVRLEAGLMNDESYIEQQVRTVHHIYNHIAQVGIAIITSNMLQAERRRLASVYKHLPIILRFKGQLDYMVQETGDDEQSRSMIADGIENGWHGLVRDLMMSRDESRDRIEAMKKRNVSSNDEE